MFVDAVNCIRGAEQKEESLIGTRKSPAHRSLNPASAHRGVCLWDANAAEENAPNAARGPLASYRPSFGTNRPFCKSREPTRSVDTSDCGKS
jgi:hypothetical protein